MKSAIESLDQMRLQLNEELVNKTLYSQYLTPVSVAQFMASLFDSNSHEPIEILDAGAGIGTLTAAVLEGISTEDKRQDVTCTLVEVDEILATRIDQTLAAFPFSKIIKIQADFIEWAVKHVSKQISLFEDQPQRFSHIILNPPYQKINSRSTHRKLLSEIGIETVNLYTAFVALAIQLLKPHGQLVAIIPRSFCNGPYYKRFRKLLLQETTIRRIHLFETRNQAFKDDDVLQENIILKLEKGAVQEDVTISTSADARFTDYKETNYAFEKIVRQDEAEKFIHIPTSEVQLPSERFSSIRYTLKELGVTVSTGPVVAFRVKDHMRDRLESSTVPMLYPTHIIQSSIDLENERKKPVAIVRNDETSKWLYPTGYYPILRRRTAKEEVKRIISAVTKPEMFDTDYVGFDNGVNVLHAHKNGLSPDFAYGLHVYMNTTMFDEYFRLFNGHTQVNATDLRAMYFPDKERLEVLGKWYLQKGEQCNQEMLDQKVLEVVQ